MDKCPRAWFRSRRLAATLAVLAALAGALLPPAGPATAQVMFKRLGDVPEWPPGTEVVPFEEVEGQIVFQSRLGAREVRDSSGSFVLDTGAGHVILDHALARAMRLTDEPGRPEEVAVAKRSLSRFEVGALVLESVFPVLTFDGGVMARITDRPVLGLFGPRLLPDRVLLVDYRRKIWAAIPPRLAVQTAAGRSAQDDRGGNVSERGRISTSRAGLSALLTDSSVAVPFRLIADGKILVSGRIADPEPPRFSRDLTLVLDTGATVCGFDRQVFQARVRSSASWLWVPELSVGTLYGMKHGGATVLPAIELLGATGSTACRGVYAMVTDDELLPQMDESMGEPVHGLLGYTYLRNFRLLVDYANQVLWLDRAPADSLETPFGLTNIGLQIARLKGSLRVSGIAPGSAAAEQAIALGDELVAIENAPAREMSVLEARGRLDGPVGTTVSVVLRRGSVDRAYRLTRRRLL